MSNNTVVCVFELWDELGVVIKMDARLEGCALPAGAIPVYLGGRPGTQYEGRYADGITDVEVVREFAASRWTERW